MTQKQIYVTFADKNIEDDFELLKKGKFQDQQLYKFIERAKQDLKTRQSCRVKIQKRLWPKVYIKNII